MTDTTPPPPMRLRMTRWKAPTYPGGITRAPCTVGSPVPWLMGRQDYGPDDLATAAADYAEWRNNPHPDVVADQARARQPPLPTVAISVDSSGRMFADVSDGHDSWLLALELTPPDNGPPPTPPGV